MEEKEIKVGDVFYTSCGYEAFLVDFYKVVKLTAKGAMVKPMTSKSINYNLMDWDEIPCNVIEEAKPKRLHLTKWNDFKVGPEYARRWNGQPIACYNYH